MSSCSKYIVWYGCLNALRIAYMPCFGLLVCPTHPGDRYGQVTARIKKQRVEGRTRAGRDKHFHLLKDFLVKHGAMTAGGQWVPGRRRFVANFAECPSPFDGGKFSSTVKDGFHQKGTYAILCRVTASPPHTHTKMPLACRAAANPPPGLSTQQIDPGKMENITYCPLLTLKGQILFHQTMQRVRTVQE